jgi:hypothetical protein
MIAIRLPGSLPSNKLGGDLRIVEYIGTLGYKHSTVLTAQYWRPGGVFYAHPEVERFTFEIVGRPNSLISARLSSVLEKFDKISKKSEKNTRKSR